MHFLNASTIPFAYYFAETKLCLVTFRKTMSLTYNVFNGSKYKNSDSGRETQHNQDGL